jgi:sugar/nucleoside kinase (ribokinase family)
VDRYFFTKLLEVYELNDRMLDEEENAAFCETLRARLPDYDVVIVVDFGHGMMSREAAAVLADGAKFLAINVQSNAANLGYQTIGRYPRADYVCIATNEVLLEARDRHGDIREVMLNISGRFGSVPMVVTRGKAGCVCYSPDDGFYDVPAFAGQVVDRIGAGDAFLSITALCVSLGAPMEVVGVIGNAVGAQAVGVAGNRSSVGRVALLRQIEALLK